MAEYLTLTEFIPGTKAKAQEVNANFTALKDAVNEKALLHGDSALTFSVANATEVSHAVNKGQLDNLSTNLTAEINKTGIKFCVKSGNTSNGKGDLFSYSVLTITPKIGGAYPNLVFSDYRGVQTTITSAANISMSGKPDGAYNIFISPDDTFYTLNNTIYSQPARPTMLTGDVWFDTSVEPYNAIKYDGTNDIQFLDMPLGKATIANSLITAVETFPFTQNGNNVNTQTALKSGTNLAKSISNFAMPNYASGVTKCWATTYQADTDGYVYVCATFNSTLSVSTDNSTWHTVQYSNHNDQGFSGSSFVPIPKGIYYKATGGNCTSLVFYPCLSI